MKKHKFEILAVFAHVASFVAFKTLGVVFTPMGLAWFVGSGIALVALVWWSGYSERKQRDSLFERLTKFKNNLSGTVEQLNGSTLQIEETTFSQASSINQTSASVHEVNTLADRNRDNFQRVGGSVENIKHDMDTSLENLKLLERNIDSGSQRNEEVIALLKNTVSTLEGLNNLFSEVESKAGIINDIVFQTKLLSFNASVEAARAGEHGKGFAVVAEEIGNLAQGSGESALSIQETLDKTKDKVKEIIGDMTTKAGSLGEMLKADSAERVKTLEGFRESFDSVTRGTGIIQEQVSEAREAMNEQAASMKEINDATLEVNESVQRNTLVVGQTKNLAFELEKELKLFTEFMREADIETENVLLDPIPWSKEYEIGIGDMDNEHVAIVDKINDLIEAMNQDHGKKIKKSFAALLDVTIDHFSHEEEFMQSFNYPSFESHKRVHENLINKLRDFQRKVEQEDVDKAKVASFLKNWLFTHIMGIDTKYAADHKEKTGGHRSAA